MTQSDIIKTPNANNEKRGRKITKADISLPTNFQHVEHIGWNGPRQVDLDVQSILNNIPKINAPIEQMVSVKKRIHIVNGIDVC